MTMMDFLMKMHMKLNQTMMKRMKMMIWILMVFLLTVKYAVMISAILSRFHAAIISAKIVLSVSIESKSIVAYAKNKQMDILLPQKN
jgi:hypothetical protein